MRFFAAYGDGLVETEGEGVEINGRTYVVHKGRDPFEKEYKVSDKETGFAVTIGPTRNKRVAIEKARARLAGITHEQMAAIIAKAIEQKKSLKVLPK